MTDRPDPRHTRLTTIAAPLFGEFVLGISVAMAGLWLASHTSDSAAASFALTQQLLETLTVFFRIIAIGAGIVVTQYLGSGNQALVRKTALTALGAGTWVGLGAAAWMLLAGELTLDLLNAPDEIHAAARLFMAFMAPSMVLEAYNLAMASILRAHLQARKSFWVMVVMHGSHLLLALVLMQGVAGWGGLGLAGYALAMFVSRVIGLLLHLMLWRRGMQLVPQLHDWWRPHWAQLKPVLRIGLPGAALELTYRLNFMVSLSAAGLQGVAALATASYVLQIQRYVLLVSMAIGWAGEIMVGQLVGARHFREADRLVRKALRNGMLASGVLALLAALGAPWLLSVFTRDPQVIAMATSLLWISVVLEIGRVSNLVVTASLRATGDVHFPVWPSVVSQFLVLGLGSYLLGRSFGLPGIWVAYAADEWLRGVVVWWRWYQLGWLSVARRTVREIRQR